MSTYTIAKYIRLSIEDEKTESLSIPNQRLILDKYIADLDIQDAQIIEFVDNGHSGTNMERPAVQELLDMVRSGGVNLLIIKDFSRFSRNAMDSGYFIEQVFPLYGVRFISVSDDFDSEDYKGNTGGIDVAFKFLMHEYYSSDLSKKIKSAKRLQMKRGENIVSRAAYGYCKKDGKWEPDGVASEVVRSIYQYALDGFSPAQIRDKLFAEQIPTPQEYLEIGRGKEVIPTYLWEARAVTRILTNEQYKGTYISGKQESKAIGSSSKNWNPKSEWIVIPNKHTPIIMPDIFDNVQEIMKSFLTSVPTPKNAKHCQSEFTPTECKTKVMPYGYQFSGDGNWLLDKVSAKIAKRIFALALQEVSEAEIAEILTNEQIPTPSEYRKLRRGKDITPICKWRTKGVRDILRDVQYTGAYVTGKFGIKSDGSGKSYRTHESDWLVIPDRIPAIVSKADFDKVNEILIRRGRLKRKNNDYLLRGNIVKCGCCGYAMGYDKASGVVFRCNHTAANPHAECHKFKVSVAELDEVMLTIIRKKAELILETSDLSKLRRKTFDEQKITDLERAIKENADRLRRVYEQFDLGEISREEYFRLKAQNNAELERLNGQLTAMKSEQKASLANKKLVGTAKIVLNKSSSEREIVEALIDKVRVYPDKRVDIVWKVAGFE